MSSPALLITQCLQNDFVEPIGRYDPIPNRLHVGYTEARRLLGENPAEGPLATAMRWAYSMPDDALRIIHIRDWHDPDDPAQREHLGLFGDHCVRGSDGALFAFDVDHGGDKQVAVVDSLTLNDFVGTTLAETLAPFADRLCRVGIVGVWTEAKVTFLSYELRTRYPHLDIAVCSALTASSSRQHHFEALDQLERILGVRVLDSVGQFVEFLGGGLARMPLLGLPTTHPEVSADVELSETDRTLVRYLFRDCRRVTLRELSGGYSGNVVATAVSVDLHGHEQVPHVLKIGPRDLMGRERSAFERVQDVMGNNAPHVSDFADHDDRGAIKYRYASMGGGFSDTFQRRYTEGMSLEHVGAVLDLVFGEELMRLYRAATLEACDLLELYGFDERWAPGVRANVEAILGRPADGPTLELLPDVDVPNICDFYERTLPDLPRRAGDQCYQSYVHGDLNGQNIVLDNHNNVWLIDFFHTRRAHVLLDLIKLENDLLYIFTPVGDDEELRQAFAFTDALLAVRDLASSPPPEPPSGLPQLERAWATMRMLRAFYPTLIHSSRDPFQLWVGQMRYAVHTLGFDESSSQQKRWALYTAARCSERIVRRLERSTKLRLDWLDRTWTAPGRVALTILPGRRDHGRSLPRDLEVIVGAGIARVLCLATQQELERYGVGELVAAYRERDIPVLHLPVVDQRAPSVADMVRALDWVEEGLERGEAVLVHCVGGLGRSGLAAAALLKRRGASTDQAMAEVRRARSSRAIETHEQEEFVREFPVGGGGRPAE